MGHTKDEIRGMTFHFLKLLKRHGVKAKLLYFKRGRGVKLGHVFSTLKPTLPQSKFIMKKMLQFFEGCSEHIQGRETVSAATGEVRREQL